MAIYTAYVRYRNNESNVSEYEELETEAQDEKEARSLIEAMVNENLYSGETGTILSCLTQENQNLVVTSARELIALIHDKPGCTGACYVGGWVPGRGLVMQPVPKGSPLRPMIDNEPFRFSVIYGEFSVGDRIRRVTIHPRENLVNSIIVDHPDSF